ncbi:DUF4340 domain-containing protein [bacterium]|nr:DUF4340 domain-containing protein [bacterium]
MKGKITFILLGILIILSVYVYLVEIKGKAEQDRAEEIARRMFPFEEPEVTKITIQRPDDTLICERGEEGWRLLSPVRALGLQSVVRDLVINMVRMMTEQEIVGEVNWSDYGLDPPQYTVVIETITGQADSLLIGDENPVGNYLFARKDGDSRVLLTSASIKTTLTKNVFDLRDQSVLRFETDQVRQLAMTRKGDKKIVIQKEGNNWKVVEPIVAYGDLQVINGIIDQINGAHVRSFEDEEPQDLSQYGLNPPDYDVTLTIGVEGLVKQLIVGKEKETNRFYAKDTARLPVFTVDNLLVDELKHTLFEMRNKRIALFKELDVFTVEFHNRGEPHFICQRDTADGWQVVFPVQTEAKTWRVESFFSFLAQVEVEDFIQVNSSNLSQHGLLSPETELYFKDKADQPLVHLATGNKVGDNRVYVLDKLGNWIYVATDNLVDNFNPNIDEYIEEGTE